jgi:dipeptidyl aminopeptidase/acylaminoacyl peptidase
MKAEDLPHLTSVSSPSISPDGATIAFSATHPDLSADATVGQLFTVPVDGSAAAVRLTRGFRDTAPAYSPDGTLVAFLRAAAGSAPQLYVVASGGGEPVQLTDQLLGVGAFEWAPSGASIAFASRVAENGRYGSIEGMDAAAEPPRHITSVKYKSNGTGYIRDRRVQLFVVDVDGVTGEPSYPAAPWPDERWGSPAPLLAARQLTTADADHGSFAWLGSDALVVAAALHDSADSDLRSGLYRVTLDGDVTRLTPADSTLSIGDVAVTPSGDVFFLAQDVGKGGRDFIGKSAGVYLLDSGEPQRLTSIDDDFGEPGSTLTVHGPDAVIAVTRNRGTSEVFAISRNAELELFGGGAVIEATASNGSVVAVAFSAGNTHGEIAILDEDLRQLTQFHAITPVATTGLHVEARDGYDIAGWVSMPEGDGPHPVLLMIHGGPFSLYNQHFFDEAEVFAGAGYAVVYCNPRGSAGYGEEHGRAIIGRMGTLDYTDVLDFLDGALAADPRLDPARLGIMGGSYGGYLTAWTIAHDQRFTAAIVERGFLDPEVFPGTSDIGDFFGSEYMGSDLEGLRAQSPQAAVGGVRTPTFVIHSEQDLRCPLGQAERYYASLRSQGVDAELLIFPGENHELSRSGRPRHRVQRFEAMLDWWRRHLPTK